MEVKKEESKSYVAQTPKVNMRKCVVGSTFKLKISDTLEAKIRMLCEKYPSTEWSGILFYKDVSGTLEKSDLVLRAEDFYLLDVGTQGYTEFDPNPDVLSYQIENDLLDCFWAIMHSHNSMDTFFSGTDMNTLQKIGSTMNHCLSLIVNNAGKYNARLTRFLDETFKCKVNSRYKTFEDAEREFSYKFSKDVNNLEWIPAVVEKEEPKRLSEEEESFINRRISEIGKAKEEERIRKAEEAKKQYGSYKDGYQTSFKWDWDFDGYESYYSRKPLFEDSSEDEGGIMIKRFAYAIITGDLFPSKTVLESKLDYVFERAMSIYEFKKDTMKSLMDMDGDMSDYMEWMFSYFGGFVSSEDDEAWNKMISLFERHSKTNEWICEIYETLLMYE